MRCVLGSCMACNSTDKKNGVLTSPDTDECKDTKSKDGRD